MVICSMNLVGVGIVSPVDDCSIPALLDEANLDRVPNHPSSAIDHPSLVVLDCPCLVCLPKYVSYVVYCSYITVSLLVTPRVAFHP